MFAYFLAYSNNYKSSFSFALLASFISYGSTPFAFAFSYMFFRAKEYKKMFIILLPNIIYISYYIFFTKVIGVGKQRLPEHFSFIAYIKQFILQFATMLDSMIGPAMLLKIFLPILELSPLDWTVIVIVAACVLLAYRYKQNIFLSKPNCAVSIRYSAIALEGFMLLSLLSMLMFALNGFYPQITFGLGNRVTIYSSVLFIYLFFILFAHIGNLLKVVLFLFFILSVLSTSTHWKGFSNTQEAIVRNIANNNEFKDLNKNDILFVVGSQYSNIGGLSHIEFFSDGSTVNSIFNIALNEKKVFKATTLNSYCVFIDGKICDKKNLNEWPVGDYIWVYNSERNKLIKIQRDEVVNFIATLPKSNRHWLQLLDKDNILLKAAVYLMPRLQYAL
jgi:hypothetical protein